MKTLRISLNLMLAAFLALAFSSVASAQATRTWVSGVGDDANPCSRTAPCKTFAGAISKTATNGEIDCLDEGGFGAVTISKSITIDCDSGPGGILASLVNGVIINAGTGTVTLRSINIQGVTNGINGVRIISAATVHLVDMNIQGFTGSGVFVDNVAANTVLIVEDTRIHDCANGITTNATAGHLVTADYSHVSIWGTGSGVLAQNGSRVQVHGSTLVANSVGVNQNTLNGTGSVVTVNNNVFTGNGTAVQSIAAASIGVSNNVFSTNSNVFNTNGGTINTASDNVQSGNAAVGATNGTLLPKV